MWKLITIFGLLFSLFCLPGSSQQVASQTTDDRMMQLEDEIWSSLDNLKANSTNLTEELEELRKLQKISQTTLTELESSLQSTLDSYNNCAQSLQNTRVELQKKQSQNRRLTLILVIILILFAAVRIIIIVLKAKGFTIPYLLNTIL